MITKEQALEALTRIEGLMCLEDLTEQFRHKEDAAFKAIRAALEQQQDPKLLPALERATKTLIAERDSLYECITDSEGHIPKADPDSAADGEYLQHLDEVIDECQAALGVTPKPAADEGAPPTPEKLEAMGFPAPGGAS